jgi:hypothetical protein
MANDELLPTVSEREKRDGIFDVYCDGRYLLSSPTPFIDGCRHLLARGYDPAARVVMRHAGSTDDALRGILGHVARSPAMALASGHSEAEQRWPQPRWCVR